MTLSSIVLSARTSSRNWDRVLDEQQLREGDRVAIALQEPADTIPLLFACWNRGLVACPLNLRLPLPQQNAMISRFDPSLVITEQEISRHSAHHPPLRAATMLMTSGSTGRPKIAVHSLENHLISAGTSNEVIPLEPGDRWELTLPLYHVGGLAILFRCALSGATVNLSSEGTTHLSLVATQLKRLLDRPPKRHTLKRVLVGGGAIPETLLDRAQQAGIPAIPTYGMTEMSSQVITNGTLLPQREACLDSSGQLWLKGPTRFLGYYEEGTLTAPFDEKGWFPTGDRARCVKGHYTILGRTDSLIISGGENIQPEEIENLLLSLPGITQAVVIGVPHPEYGERPIAYLGGSFDPDGLKSTLRTLIPGYKVPDRFLSLPSMAGLKPSRAELKKLYQKNI